MRLIPWETHKVRNNNDTHTCEIKKSNQQPTFTGIWHLDCWKWLDITGGGVGGVRGQKGRWGDEKIGALISNLQMKQPVILSETNRVFIGTLIPKFFNFSYFKLQNLWHLWPTFDFSVCKLVNFSCLEVEKKLQIHKKNLDLQYPPRNTNFATLKKFYVMWKKWVPDSASGS